MIKCLGPLCSFNDNGASLKVLLCSEQLSDYDDDDSDGGDKCASLKVRTIRGVLDNKQPRRSNMSKLKLLFFAMDSS